MVSDRILKMAHVDITQFVAALAENSELGAEFSEKEQALIYPHAAGDLDHAAIRALNQATHSIEPDGCRISKAELDRLQKDHYWHNEASLFQALDYFANKNGIHRLFSGDARASFKFKPDEKKADELYYWFERFHAAGLYLTLEDARFSAYWLWRLQYTDKFWDFFGTTFIPEYLPGRNPEVNPTIQRLINPGWSYAARFYSVTIKDAWDHHELLARPDFLDFKNQLEKNYAGMRIIDDLAYYITLFNDPEKRAMVLDNTAAAHRITQHVVLGDLLEPEEITELKRIHSAKSDEELKQIGELYLQLRQTYKFPSQLSFADLIRLVELSELGDEERNEICFAEKTRYYFYVIENANLVKPRTTQKTKTPRRLAELFSFRDYITWLPEVPSPYVEEIYKLATNPHWDVIQSYVHQQFREAGVPLTVLKDAHFLEVIRHLFAITEPHVAEYYQDELRGLESIKVLIMLYGNFPAQFSALIGLPKEILVTYAQLMGDGFDGISHHGLPATWHINGMAYSLNNTWGLLALLASRDPELPMHILGFFEAFFGCKPNAEAITSMAGHLLRHNVRMIDYQDAALANYYNKITSDDPAVRQSPKLDGNIGHCRDGLCRINPAFFIDVLTALPILKNNPGILITLDQLGIKAISWKLLREVTQNPQFIRTIQSPVFGQLWHYFNKFYENDYDIDDRIRIVLLNINFGTTPEFIAELAKAGYPLALETMDMLALLAQDKTLLGSADFKLFLNRYTTEFFPRDKNLRDLTRLVNLYKLWLRDPQVVDKIRSREFFEFYAEIRDHYGKDMSPQYALKPALNSDTLGVYKLFMMGVPWGKLALLRSRIGYQQHGHAINQLYILAVIAQDPELTALLQDRSALLQKIGDYLARHPVTGQREFGQAEVKRYSFFNGHEPILFLMAVYIMLKAFEDKRLLKEIATQALADMQDSRTEYGGDVVYNTAAQSVMFQLTPSLSTSDHEHATLAPKVDPTALASYHYHAVSGSQYAAFDNSLNIIPSPMDYISSGTSQLPGIVITPLGRDGRFLKLNFFLYYKDHPGVTMMEAMGFPELDASGYYSIDLGVRYIDMNLE